MLAIIPFYKRQDQLDRCLAALTASTHPVTPFVHDNTVNNLGFTRACNLGLREAMKRGDEFALLLNQDCYLRPDALANMLAFMHAHPRCAICGPKQLVAEDEDVIIHGGCTDAFPTGKHITGRVSNNDCAVSLPMPWVNGACMLVRVAALYDTGLMDEGYFLIASDSDFCFTARQRGWEVWYCAEAAVLHEGGGVSSNQKSLEQLVHFNADQLRFRDKWLGTMGWELLKQMPPPPPPHTLPPAELQQAIQRLQTHYNKNEFTQAEWLARLVLSHVPQQPDALLILGRIYTRIGLPALGVRELKPVVDRMPESGNAHLALADALILCNLADDAVHHYRRAQSLGIRNADLHNNLGVALQRVGRTSEALTEWNAALALDPQNATAKKNIADAQAK
jgi:hypothetical protein